VTQSKKLCAAYDHQWCHASTVGYFRCDRCGERVEHTDPRYEALESLHADLIDRAKRTRP
jgi:tRNA(Ile2) C34 agmatinyltransferase TiaS